MRTLMDPQDNNNLGPCTDITQVQFSLYFYINVISLGKSFGVYLKKSVRIGKMRQISM